MDEMFRNNIAKYYFYKYEQIGTKIPEIKSVVFNDEEKEVYILVKEKEPRYMKGILVTKTAADSCLYTFKSEKMGLMPISGRVSFA